MTNLTHSIISFRRLISSIYLFILFGLFLVFLVPASLAAQDTCVGDEVSVDEIYFTVAESCCSRTTDKSKRKCIKRNSAKLKKLKSVLTSDVVDSAREQLAALTTANCEYDSAFVPTCPDALSVTSEEAATEIESSACNLKFQNNRVNKLKEIRRKLSKAKNILGLDYVTGLKTEIKTLQQSDSCGQGGKKLNLGCSRIVNPRDGIFSGNVWKPADHGGYVFVTHNGAISGSAITKKGQHIANLNYTGTANPDSRGDRHHYRIPFCPSPTFYLKLGSTCYEINSCGRID